MPRVTKNNPVLLDVCILIILILCGYALYFIPLHNASFYFDDRSAIVNNNAVKKIDMPEIFKAFNTRFLTGLSFALNYKWCGLHPAGYRVTNLLIHCLNAFLVYLLIRTTLGSNGAFFASMLFLCHPIQTEAVNSITQRFVLMGTFFYLATLVLYAKSKLDGPFYYFCSLITALAAMFCKEFVVTLPIMLTLYDFYFLNALAGPWWKRCSRLLPFFIIVIIVPLLLLKTPREAIRAANIADSGSIQNHIDITRAKGGISRKQYFLTELNVVRTYVRLLFLPINQDFDYDFPLSHKMDAKTSLSGLFLLCLLAIAVMTYTSYRVVSFGILWFFIALSVESSFIPIGHVIAEYRLYLAVVGFVFLITFLLNMNQTNRKKLNLIAVVILIGFSFLTYQRNKVWKDEFTLWDDTIQKSPHKARAYNNRGLEFYGQGKFIQAVADFNNAIKINPGYAAAYNNRGVLYALKGELTQAMSDFNNAIEINPDYADALKNRALTYSQLNLRCRSSGSCP